MSLFHDFKNHITKWENVNFIVPERFRGARIYRGYDLKEAAEKMGISEQELGLIENGRKEIPKEMLFKAMTVYQFPKSYFYKVCWERV